MAHQGSTRQAWDAEALKTMQPSALVSERGSDLIVFLPGSANLRIGLASQAEPLVVPHVVARLCFPDREKELADEQVDEKRDLKGKGVSSKGVAQGALGAGPKGDGTLGCGQTSDVACFSKRKHDAVMVSTTVVSGDVSRVVTSAEQELDWSCRREAMGRLGGRWGCPS